jgi:hypothetical protein
VDACTVRALATHTAFANDAEERDETPASARARWHCTSKKQRRIERANAAQHHI